jgi:vanillate O-demethylase ferredoxin subunit
VGLTLGLLVLVSAVTGAGMAFRKELDPLVYPNLAHASTCAAPLPLDQFVTRAKAAHPAGAVDYLRIRGAANATVAVRFLDKDTLYFDRCTGAVMGSQNRYAGVFGVLEWIHRGQWASFGGEVMGIGALTFLLILSVLGVYLWWPRKPRSFVQGFVLNRKLKGPAFTLGLHRTVGAWAVVMLTLSAFTALPNAFDPVKAQIMAVGQTTPEAHPHSAPAPGLARAPLQGAWDVVQRLTPAPREVLVHVARKPKDPVEIFIIEAGAPHGNARTYLFLDAYSDRVLRFEPYANASIGSRVYYWMLSLHTGEVGGLAGQLLLFLGAGSVPVLAYTGLSAYLRRRFPKRKAPRQPASLAKAA